MGMHDSAFHGNTALTASGIILNELFSGKLSPECDFISAASELQAFC